MEADIFREAIAGASVLAVPAACQPPASLAHHTRVPIGDLVRTRRWNIRVIFEAPLAQHSIIDNQQERS